MPTGHAERIMPALRKLALAPQRAARSDGELLTAFVSDRDADAFAELVRRHGRMVLGVCRRVTGDATTAEDAFQAVFLVLARRAACVRPREQVGNWLYGVAYRTALKARTVLARRRSREKQVAVMPERTAPPAAPHWDDIRAAIDEELAALPDKLRLPVVLCDLEGRPQREVAKHLSVPPATLANRLAAARRALAERLTRRGVALSGGALAGLLGANGAAHAVPVALAAGTVKAVEALAAGTAVAGFASAGAVQLSEGVIRMMLLSKLKTVAVAVVTALALTTGVGLGLVPAARASDDPAAGAPGTAPTGAPKAKPAAPPTIPKAADDASDDVTFLRRLTLSVRGTPPTDVETFFFVSDADDDKRAKVVELITDDDQQRAEIAKKLGVPVERVKVVRVKLVGDDKKVIEALGVQLNTTGVAGEVTKWATVKGQPLADLLMFSADGKQHVVRPLVAPFSVPLADPTVKEWRARIALADDVQAVEGKQVVRLWDAVDNLKLPPSFVVQPAGDPSKTVEYRWTYFVTAADSDAEFLKRVLTDARGTAPTALELKYFAQDKDPKKREKLLDELLKEPAVQKKLGDEWKKKVLGATPVQGQPFRVWQGQGQGQGAQGQFLFTPADLNTVPYVVPLPPQPPKPSAPNVIVPKPPIPPAVPNAVVPGVPLKAEVTLAANKFEKLVDELIAAKKSDEAILEALTLAAQGRLPSDVEKALAGTVGKAPDRKAAWVAVAKALAPKGDTFKLKVEAPK
jgi:RNA polymerase sigma factor (sigma-70 family)